MTRHDLKGDAPAADEETALRARKLLAEVEERELRLAVKKREYVSIEEVRQTWTRLVGRAKELLRNKFENELPPILSGLDATAIQQESRRAIDEVLSVLHSSDWSAKRQTRVAKAARRRNAVTSPNKEWPAAARLRIRK
jgi:hypothetical protein